MSQLLSINSLTDLPIAAKQLLKATEGKKVFAFYGAMGAGKTTFIKALCDELGVKDTMSSPTFSIVNEYKAASGEKIYHFDFYRIKNISEAYDMGYEDYLYSKAYCFIEWPEKIEEILPASAIKVMLSHSDETRSLSF